MRQTGARKLSGSRYERLPQLMRHFAEQLLAAVAAVLAQPLAIQADLIASHSALAEIV